MIERSIIELAKRAFQLRGPNQRRGMREIATEQAGCRSLTTAAARIEVEVKTNLRKCL